MSAVLGLTRRRPRLLEGSYRRAVAREQFLVAGAQVGSGVGNLVFALVAARVLEPRGFAQLAAFLGLYLLVHLPAASLSAGSALQPALAAARRKRALTVGAGGGVLLAVLAFPLSGPAGVPPALLVALAAALPAAGWLALERGRLYGLGQHGRAAASLGVEPVVRLAVGVPLMLAAGPAGGALAVVMAGIVALIVTRPSRIEDSRADTAAPDPGRHAAWATLAFLGLAVVQTQDIVLANAMLDAGEAGRFAVMSTLGGAAAFATTTIPLVLLPRAARGEPHALAMALGAAGLLGAAVVIAAAVAPPSLLGAAFGPRYESVAALVVPYMVAMALFGLARVLVAHGCARGGARRLALAVGVVVLGQGAGLLALAHDARSAARVTLAATGALALIAVAHAGTAALRRSRTDAVQRMAAGVRAVQRPSSVTLVLAGITTAALAVRLLPTRGIWLDEATSIAQATLPLGDVLAQLRGGDVHPPLHHILLWALAHVAGTGETVMRMPSILAGTALVPVLYLLGRELYDRRAALLAAALAAFAPFLVWYSQEARMYGLFMLFAAVALLAQLRALRQDRVRDWAVFGAATVLMLWTQYFGIFFVIAQQAVFIAAARRRRWARRPMKPYLRRWLGTTAVAGLALLPLAGFAFDQFAANQAAGRGFEAPQQAGDVDAARDRPGVYSAMTNVLWATVGYHSAPVMAKIAALWPIVMLGALLMLGRRSQPRTRYVVACAAGPAVALFALGFLKPFLFEVRYFAAISPLLLLLLARGATGWARGTVATAVVVLALVGGMGVATADQQLNGSNPRVYDFEGALADVKRRARPGDVLLYEPDYLGDVIAYYDPGVRSAPLDRGLPRGSGARRVFLLASFQDLPPHRKATREGLAVLRKRYRQRRGFRHPQIHVWVFEKKRKGARR